MGRFKSWTLTAILLGGCLVPTAHALESAEVLTALAQVPRSEATFTETRTIAALTTPIVRQGALRYVRPDRLEMFVDKPAAERITIAGDTLTIENRDGRKQVRLADIPGAAAWVESLRATLAGDAAALARYFMLRMDGTMAAWTLSLIPADQDLANVVSRITIRGRQAQLTHVEIDERSGDRSVMVIVPAERAR